MSATLTTPRAPWQHNAIAGYVLLGANYLLPLLTLPLLLLKLGPNAYGELAFASSLMMFAVLFIDAGFDTYGARMASTTNSRDHVSLLVTSISLIKLVLISATLCLLLLGLHLLDAAAEERALYLATFLLLPGSLLFPTWLFQGLEAMRYTLVCAVAARAGITALLFALIRDPSDLVLAATLQSSATLVAGLLCLPVIFRQLDLTLRQATREIAHQIRCCLAEVRALHLAEFAERSIANSSVFILGLFVSGPALGHFAAIEKVVRALVSAQQPLVRALFPRFCNLWREAPGTAQVFAENLTKTAAALATITAVGAVLVAHQGLGWLIGDAGAADAFPLLCLWLICATLSSLLGTLWLVAADHRAAFARVVYRTGLLQLAALIVGAAALGAVGVALALLIAEFLRCLWLAHESHRLLRRSGVDPCES